MKAWILTDLGRPRRRLLACLSAVSVVAVTVGTYQLINSPRVQAAVNGNIDFTASLTRMDGFGFCEHFSRAAIMNGQKGETPANAARLIDLLFSRESGAGISILRLGITAGT